ncbi:hypothetical protein [Ideonella sp. YS5]|uniref:hypothetical protein n=1 Tax=Ideonella sp. YS5 TaxID=3453714 RepID=UPI003EE842BE
MWNESFAIARIRPTLDDWPPAAGVQYRELCASQRHFNCRPLRAMLSTQACADNVKVGRPSCHGCGVGALHRVEHADAPCEVPTRRPLQSEGAPPLRFDPPPRRQHCVRCWTQPGSRDRGGLVVDAICVSCFNRAREARAGRNAKGHRPAATRVERLAVGVIAGPRYWLVSVEVAFGGWRERSLQPFRELEEGLDLRWPTQEPAIEGIAWLVPQWQADAAHAGAPFGAAGPVRRARPSPLLPRRVSVSDVSGWRALEVL